MIKPRTIQTAVLDWTLVKRKACFETVRCQSPYTRRVICGGEGNNAKEQAGGNKLISLVSSDVWIFIARVRFAFKFRREDVGIESGNPLVGQAGNVVLPRDTWVFHEFICFWRGRWQYAVLRLNNTTRFKRIAMNKITKYL